MMISIRKSFRYASQVVAGTISSFFRPYAWSLAVVSTFVACTAPVQATTVYVDDSAPVGGNGFSWTSPFNLLQDALAFAQDPKNGVTEVHIAGGVYKPDQGANQTAFDRFASFMLIDGVAFRGGYAGFGAIDPQFRDIVQHETVLSGDLWSNDLPGATVWDTSVVDNSIHVAQAHNLGPTTIIDGVTFHAGRAYDEDPKVLLHHGSGLVLLNSLPEITGCTFRENVTGGALLYAFFSGAGAHTLANCKFIDNRGSGSAIQVALDTAFTLSLLECRFEGNSGASNGTIEVFDQTLLICNECEFSNNTALDGGNGGAIDASGSLELTNCSFTGNSASGGGAVFCSGAYAVIDKCIFNSNTGGGSGGGAVHFDVDPAKTASVTACVFYGNTAFSRGGAIYHAGNGDLIISDSVFEGNSTTSTSTGQGGAIHALDPAVVNQCEFKGNSSRQGGACYLLASGTFSSCLFDSNSAVVSGGAVYALFGWPTVFDQCYISRNVAGTTGGALYAREAADLYVFNSAIVANQAITGAGAYIHSLSIGSLVRSTITLRNSNVVGNVSSSVGGGIYATGSTSVVESLNSILWANTDISGGSFSAQLYLDAAAQSRVHYCCLAGVQQSIGIANFADDPLFVDIDGSDDILGTADDSMQLHPQSPCVDAGNNWGAPLVGVFLTSLDLDSNARIMDGLPDSDPGCGTPFAIDVGAVEHSGPPASSLRFADVNLDMQTNVDDLLSLLAAWGPCPSCCISDLVIDGNVNVDDLLALLGTWGP